MKVRATVTFVYEYELDPQSFAEEDTEISEDEAVSMEETSITDAVGDERWEDCMALTDGNVDVKVEKI